MKNILIIGGSAGGATLAAELRRQDETSKITILEAGPDISYGNCSLPYYFSGLIENIEDLVINSPDDFKKRYNVDVHVNTRAVKIDPKTKTLTAEDIASGKEESYTYDILVLSTGARPAAPPGLQADNSFYLRNVQDVRDIDSYIKKEGVREIAVIGNGYIGVELAESFTMGGYKVKLIGSRDQILPILDEDMAQFVHKEMIDKGVDLILGSRGQSIEGDKLVLENGQEIRADLFVVSIGIKQNTDLVEDLDMEIGPSGGIVVDENYQTSIEDIYAIGDVIELDHKLSGEKTSLALAFPAHRQATIMAKHLYDKAYYKDSGVIGTSILKCFDLDIGSTGFNSKDLEKRKIPYESLYLSGSARVHGGGRLAIKILFSKDEGRLLGAQVLGTDGVDKRLATLSTLLFMGARAEDLWNNELAYMPEYSTTKDITNVLGNRAMEILDGSYVSVPMEEVRDLVENGAYILDNRSQSAFAKAHIKGSVNIPVKELRSRLDELPKDQTIYTLSATSYKIVKNSGYEVVDIQGSVEELSNLEYYKDKKLGRDPIVVSQ